MTIKKKRGRKGPPFVHTPERTFELEVWRAFAAKPNPEGPAGSYLIEERHPLEVLVLYFEVIEWEVIPFDPDEHRVPDHPPSANPIAGCDCIGCTGRPRLNLGWRS